MKKRRISFALEVSLIYAFIGGSWILLSDRIAALLFPETDLLLVVQTYKGWFYVAVTALALFALIKNEKRMLKVAEKTFSDLLEATAEGFFRSTPDGRFIVVNKAMSKIFGYGSPLEMIDQITTIDRQIHLSEDSRRQFIELLDRDGVVEKFEARNLRKDGSIIWTSTNARVVRDEKGKALYYEGLITDITKQKNTETALMEAEERYRTLVENLPAVVFMDNFQQPRTTHYISPRLMDLLGYTPEEWEAGNNLWENSLHPEDRERVLAEDIRTDETGESFRVEYRLRHRDGHYVWIKEDASLVQGKDVTPLFWHGILLDITNQKQAEENLQRQDAILKAVGYSAELFLKLDDWEECIGQVLEALGKATQVSRAYVFKKYLPPDNAIRVTQVAKWSHAEVKSQIENPKLQDKDFAADGFSRWIEYFDKGLPVYGSIRDFPEQEREFLAGQDILSLVCIPLQIGKDWWGFIGFDECTQEREWKEAEMGALKAAANTLSAAIKKKQSGKAILDSETSYKGLFNSIQEAIYIQDADGFFLDVNDGAVQMYGYSREHFIGKTPAFLGAPGKNDMDKALKAVRDAFNGEPQQLEFWGLRSNGEVFPKDVRLFKGTYFGQDVVIAVAQDITQRKHNEDEIQRQLKELTALHAVALAESTSQTVDELLKQVTNIIGNMLYFEVCGVMLLTETGDKLKPHFSYRGTNETNLSLYIPLTMGITGKVAASGQPICTGDVSHEPAYYESTPNIRSELCVPINNGAKVIGVLNVESREPDAFTANDERLLSTIAGGMSKAIERIQLFEVEQKRRKQAEVLRETTGELNSFSETEDLFEKIFNSLTKLIDYDSASIEMFDHGYFEIIAGRNIPRELIGRKYMSDLKKWGGLHNLRKPVIVSDVQYDKRFTHFGETSYIRGWMAIPLFVAEKIVGFLNLDSRTPFFFNEEHASIAQTFANQASIALENARLFDLERQRRNQAEILSQATSALANTLDINNLYENILDWLYKIAPYDSASIMLHNGDTEKFAAMRNLPESFQIGQVFPLTTKWKQVADSRAPYIIEDAQQNDLFEKWEGTTYIHGWMCVAMYAQDKLIGFINLDSKTAGAFTKEHGIIAQTFANQAATSLENSRLFTETKQRLEELEVVSRISFSLRAAHDTQEMLPILLDEIKTSMDTDSAAIWLYDIGNNELVLRATAGRFDALQNQNFKPGDGIVGTVYSSGVIHASPSPYNDPLVIPEDNRFFGEDRSGIVVPIRTATEIIGTLAVALTVPHKIKPHQTRLVTTLAEIAGNAIYRSNLYQRSEEQIQRLITLRELDTAIASSLDIRITLNILIEHLIKKMEASAVTVLVFDPRSQTFDYYATAGFKNRENLRTPLNLGDGMAGEILLSRRALYIKDVNEETSPISFKQLKSEQFRSYYAIPLFSKGATRGILETYFRQPFSPSANWIEFVHTLAEQAVIAIDNAQLFENLQHTNQELSLAYDTTLEGWGKALELRDKETQGHTQRVTGLTLELARQMGIPEPELLQIRRGCLLHDIGKMGVPDNILHKKGALTEKEQIEMRKHTQYAYDMLHPIEYLRPALDIVYCHHEWWDGSGYPQGLKGEEIPLSARIFAVIDVWDALSSDRPYRHAWEREEIIEYIRGLSGKQFDPQVVEAFFRMIEDGGK